MHVIIISLSMVYNWFDCLYNYKKNNALQDVQVKKGELVIRFNDEHISSQKQTTLRWDLFNL